MRARRFMPRRQGVRRTRNGGWTGYNIDATLTPGTVNAFILWDELQSNNVNASGMLVPKRILIHMSAQPAGTADQSNQLSWYVTSFDTDLAQAAPTALYVDPSSTDTDLMEKRMLTMGTHRLIQRPAAATAPALLMNRDIDLKPRGFKFSAQQEELDFVIVNVAAAAGDCQIHLEFRVYCTWA